MQGTQDISVHVGTLHLTAKAVIEDFGDDIHPGMYLSLMTPIEGERILMIHGLSVQFFMRANSSLLCK